MILSFESEILLNVLKYLKNNFKKNNFILKKHIILWKFGTKNIINNLGMKR